MIRELKIVFIIFLIIVGQSFSQTVVNGSVTGTPAGSNGILLGSAPGWSSCKYSPDLCNTSFESYTGSSYGSIPSPDGGTWLGLSSAGECAQTTITGLTVGATYVLSFYGANFGASDGLTWMNSGGVYITVGTLTTQYFYIPYQTYLWDQYNFSFTANSSTMTLLVEAETAYWPVEHYTSVDGFTILTPLPVVLLDFKAEMSEVIEGGVDLKWATAHEVNNDFFRIERSNDLKSWNEIQKVKGMGTSTSLQEYTSVDESPEEGTCYYRLVQVDFDGAETYSEVVSVEINSNNPELKIYPNPTTEEFSLEVIGNYDSYRIIDLMGNVVASGIDARNKLSLSSGIYLVQLLEDDKVILQEKLMVN